MTASIKTIIRHNLKRLAILITGRPTQIPQKTKSIHLLVAIIAGALGVLAFAPFSFWPTIVITLSAATWLVQTASTFKQACKYGFALGLGFFGAGVSWVYVSIIQYGQIGFLLSALATLLFVLVFAIYYAVTLGLAWRIKSLLPNWPLALILAISFLLMDFVRSYLFTGFPWLLTGYSLHKTWLFELAPIGGIWLLCFLAVLSFTTPISLWLSRKQPRFFRNHLPLLAIILLSWGSAIFLSSQVNLWSDKTGEMQVTLVQGNLKQDEKWLPENAQTSLDNYLKDSLPHLDSDLIVWPETAITYLYDDVKPYLSDFSQYLAEHNTTLITGVPVLRDEARGESFYNAVWATGENSGLYFKQHLVPFGEYIPFESLVGKVLDIFGMPLESFRSGDADQAPIQVNDASISNFICYEIAFPNLVRKMIPKSNLILTVSNDGWFGNSIAPWQHLEIAQFRAKESGRYVIRATNTGVTAIINEEGKITQMLPQFVKSTMTAKVALLEGQTPYVKYGNLGLLALLVLMILGQFILQPIKRVDNQTA